MENNKSRRCSCGTPRLRNRRSHACSTCRKQVNRSRREELNFLNLLNGSAQKRGGKGTCRSWLKLKQTDFPFRGGGYALIIPCRVYLKYALQQIPRFFQEESAAILQSSLCRAFTLPAAFSSLFFTEAEK